MATIIMNDAICNVVYVDAGIGTPGDGNTPSQALLNIPSAASMANNTVYLCRRNETNSITMFNSTKSSGSNIYIIGMPKSTDWLYDRIPSEAKTAWDSDTANYCLIKWENYNSQMVFSDIDNFGCHRLWFVRINPNSGSGAQGNGKANLDVRSNSNNGSYFFTNNKWTDDSIDLSNPSWNTGTPRIGGNLYFVGGTADGTHYYGKTCIISDNHFQFNYPYNTHTYTNPNSMLGVYRFNNVILNNNIIWHSSQYNDNNIHGTVSIGHSQRVEVNHNTIKMVVQNTSTVVLNQSLIIDPIGECTIVDNNISVDRYYNLSGISQEYVHRMFYVNQNVHPLGKMFITDISVNIDELKYLRGDCVQINSYTSSQMANRPESVIKNISAVCKDISAITSGTRYGGGWMMSLSLNSHFTPVENIIVHNYGNYGLTAASPNGTEKAPVLKNVSIKGRIDIRRTAFAHISHWSTDTIANNIFLIENASVYIAEAILNTNWTTNSWLYYYGGVNNQVIIDSININPFINWNTTPAENDGVWINNVGGFTGKWYGTNRYYKGETWNVYRDGGASASIKLSHGQSPSDSRTALFIAPRPWRGLEWTPSTTGQHYAKVYVAHKFYAYPNLLSKRFRILVEVPTANNTIKTYTSDVNGQWETDSSSIWYHDSGMTQKVCTIPFIVEITSKPITVRILFDWYDSTGIGYLYLDPLIVFV